MDGYDATTYGRSFADVYDDWYHDVSDVEATVAAVAARARVASPAGTPRILELGAGTGRLALPLAVAGLHVVGVDASPDMLARARAKAAAAGLDPDRLALVEADMAAPLPDGPFAVAFVAFNTLFNLTTAEAQARCFAHVAERLGPGGAFAVEAFVPPDPVEPGPTPTRGDDDISLRDISLDRVVLTVARRDPAAQTITGQHVEITEAGGVRLRPWLVRYASPAELDAMAAHAGLALEARHADWHGTPFDDASAAHVSWYRR